MCHSENDEIYHPSFAWYVERSSSVDINPESYHLTAFKSINYNKPDKSTTFQPGGGGGNSTLIRRVYATGVINLSPCSGVGKPKKDTLLWSYRSFLKSYRIVLYCIVLYCIVLYCTVLYCIVLHCIGDKYHVYALYLFNQMITTIPL